MSEWIKTSTMLRDHIPAPLYDSLIRPLKPSVESKADGPSLILTAPDSKMVEHLRSRYLNLIRDILSPTRFRGQVSLRSFSSGGEEQQNLACTPRTQNNNVPENRSDVFFATDAYLQSIIERLIQPASIARTVLFIYGEPGSGKTGLLQELRRQWSKGNILSHYMSMESFLTEFATALQKKENIQWRDWLRSHTVLIIDDFQFIKPGGKKSQEELRNLIDDFQTRGHKLVLLSDAPMEELSVVNDLKSRLFEGSVISLPSPSEELRRTILEEECRREGVDHLLNDESLTYLTRSIRGDLRRIRSVSYRLAGQPHGMEAIQPFSRHQLDALCSDLYTPLNRVDLSRVLSTVAGHMGVSVEAIQGPGRERSHTLARHLLAYILTEHLNYRLVDAARAIGRKDHVSVIHARDRIEKLLKEDLFLSSLLQTILNDLNRT